MNILPGNKIAVTIETDRTLFCDVDETLVLTEWKPEDFSKTIVFNHFGHPFRVLPHLRHVEAIKQFKARGHGVVVWSAGGPKWAQAVVIALGLMGSVDLITGKPDWHIDDKPCTSWMGERFYLDLDGKTIVDDRDETTKA